MATMVVTHDVEDYAAWREGYDRAQDLRDEHGCTDARVLRHADDGNRITVLHDFDSIDAARGFAEDPTLAQLMKEAGVVGPPQIDLTQEA